MSTQNRTWLIYANSAKCNHADAIHNLGFISWAMAKNYKFAIGDTVYVFMSDERRVRFKMQVEAEGIKREDGAYCNVLSLNDTTYRLHFVAEYNGKLLNEDELLNHGFKGGGSIQNPSYNGKYMDYIKSVFNSIESVDSMSIDIADRPMMVVDLFSGSYTSEYIGHEVLNLEKNQKDGRYYGYCPPHDNIAITSLGASRKVETISGVTVIYVKKRRGSNDREVIGFCENATVHNKAIDGKLLKRYLDKENGYCSYSIESDTMENLMDEEDKFVIRINDYKNKMFRPQKFYKGTYPELDQKLFTYIKDFLNKKDVDDDDALFQLKVQNVDETSCSSIGDNSKEKPNFASGKSSLEVTKSPTVSKHALIAAKYICAGNHGHVTFETSKGKPYMEGHHLIPCTYTNTQYFWNKQGLNIDCQANIVCLCPTCHRQIHYGSNSVKRALIEKLYSVKKEELDSVGISISLDELLKFYLM